jgi:pyruvate dehydrogenase E2 component (dihydrolipoamide acetyltransferase)
VATAFKLPELGENIDTGDLVRLMVAPGTAVTEGQPVMELETDKAVIEVPSSVSGTVEDVQVKTGDKVKVGQVIFTVHAGGQTTKAEPQSTEPKTEQDQARARVQTAAREEGKTEEQALPPEQPAEVHAQSGEPRLAPERHGHEPGAPSPGREPAADQTSAPAAKVEQPPETQHEASEPEDYLSGQQAAQVAFQAAIRAEGKTERAALPPDRPQQQARIFEMPSQLVKTAGPEHREPVPAAPHVRRLARELGVDIYQVKGSGPGGRISEDDVKAFTKAAIASMAKAASAPARIVEPGLPDFSKWGKIERVSMRGVRRKTAEHMAQAWRTIPHVTQHDKADITELEQLRARFAAKAEQAGGKLTVTAIALKVCASALRVFPQFNASIDMAKEEVIYKQYTHIGVAVDTDRGLLVPVIHDVDHKNITELAVELTQLSKKAREKKLAPEEMDGGTFTITNLGGIGGTTFSPIVNYPEVAILGMSRSRIEPVWKNDKFEPRLMLPLSLSYDHRLIDGADAARFLRWVAEAIEEPFLLSVQG